MVFVYYYKTSDGSRHEAEIGAPSRDEAFAALRVRGIRPIKMVEKKPRAEIGVRTRLMWRLEVAVVVFLVLSVCGFVWFRVGRRSSGNAEGQSQVERSGAKGEGERTSPAQPLARQRIFGNRERIERIPVDLFRHPSEEFLSRFAEPGRKVADWTFSETLEADFAASLKEPVMVATGELTEYIDLKRIVAGMKREMRAYLSGGGTIKDYVGELVKRQKMEIAYRDKAEKRLEELLKELPEGAGNAYAYWLKANASLQAMGIAPITLPDGLRSYQMSLEIDDEEGVPTLEAKAVESAPVAIPGT